MIHGDEGTHTVCQARLAKEGGQWEEWVRVLANSTNPRDTDLLIAKIKVLVATITSQARTEGEQDGWKQGELHGIAVGRKEEEEEAEKGAESLEILQEAWFQEGKEAGRKAERERVLAAFEAYITTDE